LAESGDSRSGGDQCTAGLNFVPARPRRDILQDYKEVLERIYAPAAFFRRLTMVGQVLRRPALCVRPSRAVVAKDLATLARRQIPGNRENTGNFPKKWLQRTESKGIYRSKISTLFD
jgi:hypothetical protein